MQGREREGHHKGFESTSNRMAFAKSDGLCKEGREKGTTMDLKAHQTEQFLLRVSCRCKAGRGKHVTKDLTAHRMKEQLVAGT
jgi:hypothetical protein